MAKNGRIQSNYIVLPALCTTLDLFVSVDFTYWNGTRDRRHCETAIDLAILLRKWLISPRSKTPRFSSRFCQKLLHFQETSRQKDQHWPSVLSTRSILSLYGRGLFGRGGILDGCHY